MGDKCAIHFLPCFLLLSPRSYTSSPSLPRSNQPNSDPTRSTPRVARVCRAARVCAQACEVAVEARMGRRTTS